MHVMKFILLLCIVITLSSCATFKDWFGGNKNTYQDENANMTNLSGVRSSTYQMRDNNKKRMNYYNPVEHDTTPETVVPAGSMLERYQQKRQMKAEKQDDSLSKNDYEQLSLQSNN